MLNYCTLYCEEDSKQCVCITYMSDHHHYCPPTGSLSNMWCAVLHMPTAFGFSHYHQTTCHMLYADQISFHLFFRPLNCLMLRESMDYSRYVFPVSPTIVQYGSWISQNIGLDKNCVSGKSLVVFLSDKQISSVTSTVGNVHVLFDCWLNFGLSSNSFNWSASCPKGMLQKI